MAHDYDPEDTARRQLERRRTIEARIQRLRDRLRMCRGPEKDIIAGLLDLLGDEL